jgi:hypothetical protein
VKTAGTARRARQGERKVLASTTAIVLVATIVASTRVQSQGPFGLLNSTLLVCDHAQDSKLTDSHTLRRPRPPRLESSLRLSFIADGISR